MKIEIMAIAEKLCNQLNQVGCAHFSEMDLFDMCVKTYEKHGYEIPIALLRFADCPHTYLYFERSSSMEFYYLCLTPKRVFSDDIVCIDLISGTIY